MRTRRSLPHPERMLVSRKLPGFPSPDSEACGRAGRAKPRSEEGRENPALDLDPARLGAARLLQTLTTPQHANQADELLTPPPHVRPHRLDPRPDLNRLEHRDQHLVQAGPDYRLLLLCQHSLLSRLPATQPPLGLSGRTGNTAQPAAPRRPGIGIDPEETTGGTSTPRLAARPRGRSLSRPAAQPRRPQRTAHPALDDFVRYGLNAR